MTMFSRGAGSQPKEPRHKQFQALDLDRIDSRKGDVARVFGTRTRAAWAEVMSKELRTVLDEELRQLVRSRRLAKREADALRQRFGLDDDGETIAEVRPLRDLANRLGIAPATADDRCQRAFAALAESPRLRAFWEGRFEDGPAGD